MEQTALWRKWAEVGGNLGTHCLGEEEGHGRNLGPEEKGKSLWVDCLGGPLRIGHGRIAGLSWNNHLLPPW